MSFKMTILGLMLTYIALSHAFEKDNKDDNG